MNIDIILTIAQIIVGLFLAAVGVEMANNPPQTAKQKWMYRSIFIALGILAIGITVGQAINTDRNQRAEKQIADNDRTTAEQDRLDRVKEVSNLQGQLQSMQQC